MKLALCYVNLLRAIKTLELEGVEVTPEGLTQILKGVIDFETIKYVNSSAFGYFPSYTGRRTKGRVNHLMGKGYLETKDSFLCLTKMCDELELRPLEKKDYRIPESKNIRFKKEDR